MKAWLAIGLLIVVFQAVPKQADKPHANENGSKNLSEQPKQPATGETPNIPLPGPSTAPKEDSSKRETKQPSWCEKLISPVVSNWPLITVAIWGILVARGTLNNIGKQTILLGQYVTATKDSTEAMRKSVGLQEVALTQWVDIENWKATPWIPEGGELSLHVQFDIVNPTNLPLTLNSVSIALGGQESKVGGENLIPPKKSQPIVTSVKISEEKLLKWEDLKELVFMVKGYVDFEDAMKKPQTQPFSGLIACSEKGGVRFIPPYGSGLYIADTEKKSGDPN